MLPNFSSSVFKRLEPPYLACILLTIGLAFLSQLTPGFRGTGLHLTPAQLLAHLGYVNAFLGYGWINPAFWTLAIEFQYYIFVAVVFPLIDYPNQYVRMFSVGVIAILGLCGLNNEALLLHWLPLFAMGMASYQFILNRVSREQYIVLLLLAATIGAWSCGTERTVVGLVTSVIISACGTKRLPSVLSPLASIGTISYSLYLVHIPIGTRITNLATRLPELVIYRYLALTLALAVSIGASWLFWYFIEKPSQRWSQSKRPSVELK